ncbi:kinase-like domain-containing protein [Xylaria palmicola]|nr:kinase-like domain-containing protein [Xylaria palmicola]
MPLPPAPPYAGIANADESYFDVIQWSPPANQPAHDVQAEASDWDMLCLEPVLSQHASARIIIRPKIQWVNIGPYKTHQAVGQWAEVKMADHPDVADVFIVEPEHLHIGCVVSHDDATCHLFFDPENDHLHFHNCGPHALSVQQLHGPGWYWLLPDTTVRLEVGVWNISTDAKPLVEIQVLKRKDWSIWEPRSSERTGLTDGDSSKRVKLSDGGGPAWVKKDAIAKDSQAAISNNPLVELKQGQVILVGVGKVYWLGRLGTIHGGAMSTVWHAQHSNCRKGEKIVVKIIKPGPYGGDVVAAANAWKKECETHVHLNGHPNIVPILGFDARFHSIYTAYLHAEALSSQLREGASFSGTPADALNIMQGIASAICHSHSKNRVHNDIKPGNILYSPESGAVLIDFGLSTILGETTLAGTSFYLPPEYMGDWMMRGAPTDIWALGVVMLWVLGRMTLPDLTEESWAVEDIHSDDLGAQLAAVGAMTMWLDYIEEKRSELDDTNPLEAIVKMTLEAQWYLRPNAAELNCLLQRIGH